MHDDELTASLTDLSGLLSEHRGLELTLRRIAELAVAAIPGAEGAGLTLLESDRQQTVVWTEQFVRDVDDIQYGLDEGPCVSAVTHGQTFTSGNLGGAAQWPRFGPRVGRLGVHSALSLPLLAGDRVLGALNVYARDREAFDDHSVRLGEAFSGPAAVSVSNAQMLAQAERLVGQLTAALTSRADIDQALGIVRSRTGGTSEAAFARLRAQSQATQVKLVDIARGIVNDAVARARARHDSD
jgi:GAF domain-containing protein